MTPHAAALAALTPEVVEAAHAEVRRIVGDVPRSAVMVAIESATPAIVAAVVRSLAEQSHDDEDSTLDTCDEEIAAVLATVGALRVELARTRGKLDIAQAIAVNCFGGRRAP